LFFDASQEVRSMNTIAKKLAVAIGGLAFVTSCAQTPPTSPPTTDGNNSDKLASAIQIDGSSTVYPITEAIAKEFQAMPDNPAKIEVKISGTTGGFKKFCAGQTDISNASRPILQGEIEACSKNNVRYMEFPIAFDALTVVVNPANDWAQDITIAELKKIWEPAAEKKITRWNQVRASWPDKPLTLYGAGDKSGTFDYFAEAVVGKTGASRRDYTASEDDNELVEGVSKDPHALGYFGFAYYEQHQDKVKALAIDSGKGPVLPSLKAVLKNQYQPLARPLFIYVNPRSNPNRKLVDGFVKFYIKQSSQTAKTVGYIPLPDAMENVNYVRLNTGKVGTSFGGKEQLDLKVDELQQKVQ
jgi:phosphate transport system substrate-binding protein